MNRFITSIRVLKPLWEGRLNTFQVEPTDSQEVFLDLVAAYSSVGRYYHTLEHIQQVLETIESIRTTNPTPRWQAANFPAIELAAWFHDVIYDSQAKNNEEKSAEYAVTALNELGIPIFTVERVKQLILNTKTHQALTDDIDSQILLDSDLAILGAPEWQYKAYVRSIRQEYSWMNDQPYRVGRKQV
jgi:predicted metal-dependent HD superfamily phosphohydrolase